MRRRSGLVLLAACGLLLSAAGSAPAKKVTETAPGLSLPDATSVGMQTIRSEATQTFKLKGEKVRRKQVLDVNVTLNATSASTSFLTVTVRLLGPNGNGVNLGNPGAANFVNVKFDDQSTQFACNPMSIEASNCNYLQGSSPTFTATGTFRAAINPTFKGGNPKGTWKLFFQDFIASGDPPTAIGLSTLEVKTGKRFEKAPD